MAIAGTARFSLQARDDRRELSPAPREGAAGEEAIVARAMADPAAFAPLYEHYVDAIYGYCRRRVADDEAAADLTSRIFIKALAALPAYRARNNRTSFRSWLFTIAHNMVIDGRRTHRAHRPLDESLELPAAITTSPEEHAIAADLRDHLTAAMEVLTEPQRQVVELRFAGLNGPEIANVLGMRVEAVKSLQFRAYARLRERLGDRFGAEYGREESR